MQTLVRGNRHPFPTSDVEAMQTHGSTQLPPISGQQEFQGQLERHVAQTNEKVGTGDEIYCLVLEKSD